ncbi:MAG: hypothetical protein LAP39_12630 [Acidobacteriia bacterium]|nr:hypothetical protein [Terriglobia bacterium]
MRKVLVSLAVSSALGLPVLGQLVDPGSNGIVKRTALNATAVAVAGTDYQLPIAAGTGIVLAGGVTVSYDTAVMLTQAMAQAGTPFKCTDAGGSGTTYSCVMWPALVSYTDKQMVIFTPNTACAGGLTTLNINGLGAKQIYKTDGATNPSANDCRAGLPALLLYNASLNGGNGGFQIASALTNSLSPLSVGNAIASAATIAPTAPLTHITGTTQITTITVPTQFAQSGFGGCLRLIPDGAWATGTTGNIALASTAAVSKVLEMCYDNATAKWYPSY